MAIPVNPPNGAPPKAADTDPAAKPAAVAAQAPKAAGSEPEQAVYVMATADGTFANPGEVRARFYAQGQVFVIPGKSFLRRWMKLVNGPNVQPPARPPETTAANQPGFNNTTIPQPPPLVPPGA